MKSCDIIILLFLVFHANMLFAQQEKPYAPGEYLKFDLSYSFIKAGEAIIETNIENYEGKPYEHIKLSGYTVGLADKIYKVYDVYESYVDAETVLPRMALRNISEGKYKRYNEVLYYHDSIPDSTVLYSQKRGRVVVQDNMKDILGTFFYARWYYFNEDSLVLNEMHEMKAYFQDELYDLRMKYLGNEVIDTEWGKMECYKFSPVTEVGRIFETEDDMRIWISADANKIPMRIQFDMFVGHVKCVLKEARGLKQPFN